MTRWLMSAILAWPLPCAAAASQEPLTVERLRTLADQERCEATGARVIFAGNSAHLGECLEKLGKSAGLIEELRITSRGGGAWDTLQLAERLRGRLSLLIVDGLCASSCANYLVPVAARLRVEPRSYVLLHGSLSERDTRNQHEQIRQQVRDLAKTQAWGKDLTEAEVAAMAQESVDRVHADLATQLPVQRSFAGRALACDDWLDVWEHFDGQEPPRGTAWLLVTPDMAARCLRITRVESFWAPERQEAFEPRLGFFRALK